VEFGGAKIVWVCTTRSDQLDLVHDECSMAFRLKDGTSIDMDTHMRYPNKTTNSMGHRVQRG
jgi:hypothetical protein